MRKILPSIFFPLKLSMSEDTFVFRNFSVYQGNAGMRITTDSVLFASWCDFYVPTYESETILDVGTGTGVIALILAMRREKSEIIGIDIENSACEISLNNFKNSPYKERLSVVNKDFRDYQPRKKFNIVVSNPPYFIPGLKCREQKRDIARSEIHWDIANFWRKTKEILCEDGRVALVIPVDRLKEYEENACTQGFSIINHTFVSGNLGAQPYAVFIQATLSKNDKIINTRTPPHNIAVRIPETGRYTRDVWDLTKDLYLWKKYSYQDNFTFLKNSP